MCRSIVVKEKKNSDLIFYFYQIEIEENFKIKIKKLMFC